MAVLEAKYNLKEESVGEPTDYLGAEIRKWNVEDAGEPDKTRWAMSSDRYVKRAVVDVELELSKYNPPEQ